MADLLDYIDFRALEALNVQPGRGVENALKQVRGRGVCGRERGETLSPWPRSWPFLEEGPRKLSAACAPPAPFLTPFSRTPPPPSPHSIPQGPRDDARLFAESDTDDQLLLNIPFTQAVRLTGVALSGPAPDATGYDADAAPRSVRLFVNRPSLGFAEAEADPAAQEVEVGGEGGGGGAGEAVVIPLKAARFKGVTSLALFFQANAGGAETTQVGCVKLFGSAGETFDVAAIKKAGEEGGPGA